MASPKPQNAGPNTPAPSGLGTTASAGGHGEESAATGLQVESEPSSLDWANTLALDTVKAALGEPSPQKPTAEKPARKPAPAEPSLQTENPESEADADEDDEDSSNQSVLPDEDEDDDSDPEAEAREDDGEADETPEKLAKKAKALERDNFKAREKARTLQAEIEEKSKRIAELETQIRSTPSVVDGMPAGFEKIQTLSALEETEAMITKNLEWAEDHQDEGYTQTAENGEQVEYSPAQIRAYRRQMAKALKDAATARSVLQARNERAEKAKAQAKIKYGFVFDPTSRRRAVIEQIEKDHPEINRLPDADLLKGRLAVALMIEQQEYTISRNKPKAAAATRKAAPPVSPPPPPPTRKQTIPAPAADGDWAMGLAMATLNPAAA